MVDLPAVSLYVKIAKVDRLINMGRILKAYITFYVVILPCYYSLSSHMHTSGELLNTVKSVLAKPHGISALL